MARSAGHPPGRTGVCVCVSCLDLLDWSNWHFVVFSFHFSPTAESFGVSAQIGSGVVRGGPEIRFYKGSTKFCKGCEVVRGP